MQGNYRPIRRADSAMKAVMTGEPNASVSNKVMLSLRVDADLKTRFKSECAARGVTMEDAGRQALQAWMRGE
ncbi:MAG: hypothetical protein LKI88_03740 [Bifidobacterium sp.]|jgi:uncharacterized protein (DUF4415 family)|nr:hypothetical protein [Bifidobacterium sp.]MCI1865032.1 hypothetical protein [Bifidobacterium sp.]